MRKLAAGNWKMNGSMAALAEISQLQEMHPNPGVDILLCPPAPLITQAKAAAGAQIAIGAQDCHANASGAHTGDIAAQMLVEVGASAIITGHSERRTNHGETDAMVAAKTSAAQAAGAMAILCLGETLAERQAGQTLEVVARQLAGSLPAASTANNTVIAYEPVWAIGTGRVATVDQIADVHAALRSQLQDLMTDGADLRILYGGSVKAENAPEIFAIPNVDGALVGGASLTAAQFSPIVAALENT